MICDGTIYPSFFFPSNLPGLTFNHDCNNGLVAGVVVEVGVVVGSLFVIVLIDVKALVSVFLSAVRLTIVLLRLSSVERIRCREVYTRVQSFSAVCSKVGAARTEVSPPVTSLR